MCLSIAAVTYYADKDYGEDHVKLVLRVDALRVVLGLERKVEHAFHHPPLVRGVWSLTKGLGHTYETRSAQGRYFQHLE